MNLKPTSISPAQLERLASKLVTAPEAIGELDTADKYAEFLNDLAQVICDHCGGEIIHEATAQSYQVTIGRNDSLPDDGGVWSQLPAHVSAADLARLTARLITDPDTVGELDTADKHAAFVNALTQVICDHCGGEIVVEATAGANNVAVGPNDSLPEDGGIWSHIA